MNGINVSDQVSYERADTGEQTRARYPDQAGYVGREGVRVFYEVYGNGEPTLLFFPPWTIAHSRIWKMQIPYFARHNRVVVFDPRGNGKSDRPTDVGAYAESEFAHDALDILDATETERAVIVSLSLGAQRALLLAAEHPERVSGAAFCSPWFPASRLGGLRWRIMKHPRMRPLMMRRPLATMGWAKFNAVHMRSDYRDLVEWFTARCTTQAHSTKGFEDQVGWALETDPDTLIPTILADPAAPATRRDQLALARRVQCPVLVIHGTGDRVNNHTNGKALAKATRGRLVSVDGGDHVAPGRRPVEVNLALREFVDPSFRRDATVHRSDDGRPRALFVSAPIGLGHVQRDIAVSRELRRLVPDLQVEWLAQDPITRVLEAEDEYVHPASEHLASESTHWESECAEHDLHCFQALRRMDEILAANFMLFRDVVADKRYDLWLADEMWDIDYYLHENPSEKRAPYVWMTDFVGYVPMADGGEREAFLTADYNAQMVEHVAAHPNLRDRAIYIGNPDDLVRDPLGPDLPTIRDWTQANFACSGYITGFDPADFADRAALRADLGYGDDERVCLVTVGGTAVGIDLLRRVVAAAPLAHERVQNLRMIVVAGPRIDSHALQAPEGVEVLPYVHHLYRNLAACDLAVVQGGVSTSMELTANRRPFLSFPLKHHFEQQVHVRHRVQRYGAARFMDYDTETPETIATAIADEIGRDVQCRDVETDGARRAAEGIAELLN